MTSYNQRAAGFWDSLSSILFRHDSHFVLMNLRGRKEYAVESYESYLRRWHEVALKLLWRSILLHYHPHQVPPKTSVSHTKGSQLHLLKGSQGLNWGPCWLNSEIWETVHPQCPKRVDVQPETFERFHCFTIVFFKSFFTSQTHDKGSLITRHLTPQLLDFHIWAWDVST